MRLTAPSSRLASPAGTRAPATAWPTQLVRSPASGTRRQATTAISGRVLPPSTAQAHILLTDTATRMQGLALLDDTAQLAQRCGLSHQLRAIQAIRLDALSEAR